MSPGEEKDKTKVPVFLTMPSVQGKIVKLLISAALIAGVIWQFNYARQLALVEKDGYAFTPDEIGRLDKLARAHYAYGRKAWYENRLEAAKTHLIRAVADDMLLVSAWLQLAQTELSLGDRKQAARIVAFTHQLTRDTLRWKWDHILLARDLGLEDILLQSINDAISCNALQRDALQLLDMYYGQDTGRILTIMAAENKPLYLQWLMRWDRVEDSWLVWNSLPETVRAETRFHEAYVDFLLSNRATVNARQIWEKYNGGTGITNPGFEQEMSNAGFGWCYRTDGAQGWNLARSRENPEEGRYALGITFDGTENVRFNHVRQIVPVEPGSAYSLSYWRKSRNLTTDERLFIDIFCFDGGDGRHWSGPMLPVDGDWQEDTILFSPPDQCRAVTIQITRKPSRRFGCKISGKAWFDGFRIERPADGPAININRE